MDLYVREGAANQRAWRYFPEHHPAPRPLHPLSDKRSKNQCGILEMNNSLNLTDADPSVIELRERARARVRVCVCVWGGGGVDVQQQQNKTKKDKEGSVDEQRTRKRVSLVIKLTDFNIPSTA